MSKHAFQTEVKQLLDIVIHSLYSEREIFLRELISNASDALDKLRFQALTDSDLLRGDEDLRVDIDFDSEAKTITIRDNGIGLTEAEAIDHLGTIAKSGTKEFVQAAKDKADLSNLIGQFGVGFYSAFMVADQIVVESRSATCSSDEGVHWESSGDGDFATETIARPQRGTTITLHLREDAAEFAERYRLFGLIKKYSDFVPYPIYLPQPPPAKVKEEQKTEDDKEAEKPEDTGPEQVNEGKALWTKSKDDISEEQYTEFYRSACKQWDEPASRLHFQVEGTLCFTGLLFIPSSKPFDLFDRNKRGLNLYVRRVFIMDDCEELLPEYLRFVRGVIDSDDLPLNVSRELLQKDAGVSKLRKQIVKRVLDHLGKLANSEDDEDQKAFIKIDAEFGKILREGIVNDFDNKDKVAKLARWQSSWTLTQEHDGDQPLTTGLEAYKARMPEGQEAIYIITAPNLATAKSAPQVEGYLKKGYEVLYLHDPVDEWVSQNLNEFDGTKLVNVVKGADDLADEETKKNLEAQTETFKPFLDYATEHLDGIKEVRLTSRLADSPCCVVSDQHGMTSNMEELMRQFGQETPGTERILELNPEHELIKKLNERHTDESHRDLVDDYLAVLRDQALLAEGAPIKDHGSFAKRVQQLMGSALT